MYLLMSLDWSRNGGEIIFRQEKRERVIKKGGGGGGRERKKERERCCLSLVNSSFVFFRTLGHWWLALGPPLQISSPFYLLGQVGALCLVLAPRQGESVACQLWHCWGFRLCSSVCVCSPHWVACTPMPLGSTHRSPVTHAISTKIIFREQCFSHLEITDSDIYILFVEVENIKHFKNKYANFLSYFMVIN